MPTEARAGRINRKDRTKTAKRGFSKEPASFLKEPVFSLSRNSVRTSGRSPMEENFDPTAIATATRENIFISFFSAVFQASIIKNRAKASSTMENECHKNRGCREKARQPNTFRRQSAPIFFILEYRITAENSEKISEK